MQLKVRVLLFSYHTFWKTGLSQVLKDLAGVELTQKSGLYEL